MNNIRILGKIGKKLVPVNTTRFFSSGIEEELTSDVLLNEKYEKSINEVKLLGRVGKDPILVESGIKSYTKFSFATNEIYKQQAETKIKTDWHNIVTYDSRLVSYVTNYVKKGQRLFISGKISYFFPEDDDRAKVPIIVMNDLVFLGS